MPPCAFVVHFFPRAAESTSHLLRAATMPNDDGGDHMKDAGLGVPPGARTVVFPSFTLESGHVLHDVVVAYSTYGVLNPAGDNGVIVGHSLTSNSCVHEWWGEMLGSGPGFCLDVDRDFVVCANYLGSPYGTSSPVTPDPSKPDGRWYAADFPNPCTIRDNVRLQRMLLDHLGVRSLRLAIGGSMGCMLALEFGASYPDYVRELVLVAGCGRHTDWAIGIGEAERFAIMADGKWAGGDYDPNDPPKAGLAAARMTAMLTYRAPRSVDDRHDRATISLDTGRPASKPTRHDDLGVTAHANASATGALPHFEVESYLHYQGRKFARRFDPNCYVQLTCTLDSHDVSRGRGEYEDVMRGVKQRALVVGITSDVLYPFHLQEEMVRLMPAASMYVIDSPHGHDAFLIEIKSLNDAVARFRAGPGLEPTTTLSWDEDEPDLPPPPRYGVVDGGFVAAVVAAVGDPSRVLTTESDRQPYAADMGHHPAALPDVVVLPKTTEETARVVRLCHLRRIPVVTRGAGTGLEGGAVAYSGGVVLDTSLLKSMRAVPGERLAVVGAGVLKNELDRFLRPHGLLFGPDPSSNPSVGGMASTGGSGMSTLKYGTSKENVVSMTVVTPAGRVVKTRQAVRKSSTGYELNALYLGAEGTLGVITELTLRLFPRPKVRCGAVVTFPTVAAAAATVVAAVAANLGTLLRCELMNDEGIRCTNVVFHTTLRESPTLFIEFVGDDRAAAEADWRRMRDIAASNGAVDERFAPTGEALDELWDARRGCYLGAMRYRGVVDGSKSKENVYVGDVCVPTSRLAECVSTTEAAFRRAGFPCVMCAHIADGNFHCLIPYKPEDESRLMTLNDEVIRRAIDMGGAASGEHGVGIGKMKHVVWEHGPFHVDAQRRIKRALDPRCIMNPGKVIATEPTEEERAARHRAMGGATGSKL